MANSIHHIKVTAALYWMILMMVIIARNRSIILPCVGSTQTRMMLCCAYFFLVAPPDCKRSYPADGFTLEGQNHTANCIIGYRASPGIAPLMTWSGPAPFVETTVTTETTVSAKISFTVHRRMAQQNWMCKTNFTTSGFGGQNSAANVPTWQHIDVTNSISVYCKYDLISVHGTVDCVNGTMSKTCVDTNSFENNVCTT